MAGLLLFSIVFPLGAAIPLGLCSQIFGQEARRFALLVTLATLAASVAVVLGGYHALARGATEFATTDLTWLGTESGFDVRFSLGLDGISLWLYGLSALLLLTSVLVSWDAIRERTGFYYSMLLMLASGCMGVFAARDILLFYIFFEFTLIPLFFLIGVWGSEERRFAAVKFFLYTLTGSLLTFLGLLCIIWWCSRHDPSGVFQFNIGRLTDQLRAHPLPAGWQLAIFWALFAGFAIKVPLFPLHTWLPLAHVQAPTAGSVFLAGILLKIGTYGFLRFSIPMLPQASAISVPWIIWLSVIGIIYGALVALAQSDMKRLVAYSSVSHLGYCMLGLFALNHLGTHGAVLQMINHGISTGALFAMVGMLYERFHTRQIDQLGGLARSMPMFAFFMVLFTFSSIGVPGLNGFAGEILVLMGAFQRAWLEMSGSPSLRIASVLAVAGVVLGAWYMLWVVQRVFFGAAKCPHIDSSFQDSVDLRPREILALAPLALFVFWIGIVPQTFIRPVTTQLEPITQAARRAVEHRDQLMSGPATELHVAEQTFAADAGY